MRNKRWIKENLTLQNLKFLASKPDPITMFSLCFEHLFSTMVLGSGAGLVNFNEKRLIATFNLELGHYKNSYRGCDGNAFLTSLI